MKRWLGIVKDWGWLLAVLLAAVVVFLLTGGRKAINLDTEFGVIAAGSKARDEEATLGHDVALEVLDRRHAQTLKELDDEQRAKASSLRHNPRALSRYLVRVGRKGG